MSPSSSPSHLHRSESASEDDGDEASLLLQPPQDDREGGPNNKTSTTSLLSSLSPSKNLLSPVKKRTSDDSISAREMKELQKVVAVFAYNENFVQDSKKQHEQKNFIQMVFHGDKDEDIQSQIHLLCEGTHERYSKLYEDTAVTTKSVLLSAGAGGHNPTSISRKKIRALYSPNNDTRDLFTGGKDAQINSNILQRSTLNSRLIITGRALLIQATEAVKNGKKALAYAKAFLHQGRELPSGKTVDDLLNHIRQKMWKDLSKKDDKEPGRSWVFPGYLAFLLYACPILVDDKVRLHVYCDGGEKEGKDASRKVGRKKKKEQNDKKRAIDSSYTTTTTGNGRERGFTVDQQLSIRGQQLMSEYNTIEANSLFEREAANATKYSKVSRLLY